MKKNLLLLNFFAFGIYTTVFAQKPEPLLIRVRYTQVKSTDTVINGKARNENMLLFVGKNASLFTSYNRIKHEISEDQKFRASLIKNTGSGNTPKVVMIDPRPTAWLSKTDYFYFVKENKLIAKEVIALQSYLVEETAPQIPWKITKDTLSFSGLNCQKATAELDGKTWTAWFAPSLPFQAGPGKLYGLPGLIVDAYDQGKTIHFQFAGVENAKEGDFQRLDDVTKRPNAQPGDFNPVDQMIGRDVAAAYFESVIKLPPNATKTNRAEFEKLSAAFEKDPRGFVRAQARY